jgi:hypothetical protein
MFHIIMKTHKRPTPPGVITCGFYVPDSYNPVYFLKGNKGERPALSTNNNDTVLCKQLFASRML